MHSILVAIFALLLAVFTALSLTGCQMLPRPQVDSGPYTGPQLAIDSWAMRHQITVTTPTGGWAVDIDQVRDANARREVFITAQSPPRGHMTTQALTPHQLDSRVDSRAPIDVYIRVVEPGADAADFPYRLADRSVPTGGMTNTPRR